MCDRSDARLQQIERAFQEVERLRDAIAILGPRTSAAATETLMEELRRALARREQLLEEDSLCVVRQLEAATRGEDCSYCEGTGAVLFASAGPD